MTHPTILTGGPWDGLSFNMINPSPVLVMEIKTQDGRLNSGVYRYAGTVTSGGNTSIYAYAEGEEDPNRPANLFRGMESGLRAELDHFSARVAEQEDTPEAAARAAFTLILDAILGTADELDRRMRATPGQEKTP